MTCSVTIEVCFLLRLMKIVNNRMKTLKIDTELLFREMIFFLFLTKFFYWYQASYQKNSREFTSIFTKYLSLSEKTAFSWNSHEFHPPVGLYKTNIEFNPNYIILQVSLNLVSGTDWTLWISINISYYFSDEFRLQVVST